MRTWIRQFLAAPVFEDQERTRVAQLLNSMLLAVLGMSLLAAIFLLALEAESFLSDWTSPATIFVIIVAVLFLRSLVRRGYIRFAGALLSLALSAIIVLATYDYGGVSNSAIAGYLLCIVIGGLLLGGRGAMVFTAIGVAVTIGMWYAGEHGVLPSYGQDRDPHKVFAVISYSVIFVIGGLLLRYASNSIAGAIEQARRNERAQAEANRELQKLQVSLEQQVADRTQALERRTVQLQAAAEVGRTVTAVLEAEQLARQVTQRVCEQFGLVYVGLFIADEANQWATLRAGYGRTGADLAANYRVLIDGNSAISQSIAWVKPRAAAEPQELTSAHSMAALPLRSRDRAMGALALYSGQPDAFDQDTVAILQSVADQVAIALENARLFAQSRAALEAARRAYGQVSRQAWSELLRARADLSMRKSQVGTFPVAGGRTPQAQAALETGQAVFSQDDQAALAVPIKVRDQVIGVIDACRPDGASGWTPEKTALLETLADQLGVALESARLYQDAQRRAAQERLIGAATARLRETLDMDTVLQVAVREIGEMLDLAEIEVRMGRETGYSSPDRAVSTRE